jgi:hypothetical protein
MSRLGSCILTFSTLEEVSWLESSAVILLFKIFLSRNKRMLFFGVQIEQRTEDRGLRGVQDRDQKR